MTVWHEDPPPVPIQVHVSPDGDPMENYLTEAGVPRRLRERPRYGSKWSRFLKKLGIL